MDLSLFTGGTIISKQYNNTIFHAFFFKVQFFIPSYRYDIVIHIAPGSKITNSNHIMIFLSKICHTKFVRPLLQFEYLSHRPYSIEFDERCIGRRPPEEADMEGRRGHRQSAGNRDHPRISIENWFMRNYGLIS